MSAMQLLHHLYADTLEKVSAFRGQHPQFLADLVSCLKLEYFVEGGGCHLGSMVCGTTRQLPGLAPVTRTAGKHRSAGQQVVMFQVDT
jgi:hypothetical protein